MATHSSVLAWRISGMGEPGGLPSVGSHRVGHDWSDLAAAARSSFKSGKASGMRCTPFIPMVLSQVCGEALTAELGEGWEISQAEVSSSHWTPNGRTGCWAGKCKLQQKQCSQEPSYRARGLTTDLIIWRIWNFFLTWPFKWFNWAGMMNANRTKSSPWNIVSEWQYHSHKWNLKNI